MAPADTEGYCQKRQLQEENRVWFKYEFEVTMEQRNIEREGREGEREII